MKKSPPGENLTSGGLYTGGCLHQRDRARPLAADRNPGHRAAVRDGNCGGDGEVMETVERYMVNMW